MESKWIILLGVFGMTISYFTMWTRYRSAKLRIKELEAELEKMNSKQDRDR